MGRGRSKFGHSPVLSKALGRKGKPKSIEDAARDTNPHYWEGPQWSRNCQRCVYAYEMQRRGYNVEAKPRILDGPDDLPYRNSPGGWRHVMTGTTEVNMPSRNTIKTMDNQMSAWGDGARAIVAVTWKGTRGGHVFIAEQQNGRTRYIDPQTNLPMRIDEYMSNAIKKNTLLVRIDNATPTDLLADCVQRRAK